MKCIKDCGKDAEWIRYTQFAGDHPFCEPCAETQRDFKQESSYFYWTKAQASIV